MSTAAPALRRRPPPRVSGDLPGDGHMAEFAADPISFFTRARAECGELAEFDLRGQITVLLTGPDAHEAFCRAPDEQLDQGAAYEFMTPIFGTGVIFDAPLPIRNQQLAIQTMALRHHNMRSYARVISEEVRRFTDAWGDSGEIELVSAMTELTLYTSTHCLLGGEFRETMSAEFAHLYHDLEAGLHALAYVDPHADHPLFRQRDAARVRLEAMIGEIVERRRAADTEYEDALATFMTATYENGSRLSANEITGLIVATMFAGHHTSSGTAAWVLLELLRHAQFLVPVVRELEDLLGPAADMTRESLREMPRLEAVVRETLRLHPPLNMLARQVLQDFDFKDYQIEAGKRVCLCPYVSHRIPEVYPEPERFDPARPEQDSVFTDISFGGGRHRCAGSAFALLQLKSIFGTLLRRFTFELVASPETYVDDTRAITLRPHTPALVRYRRKG